MQAAVAASVDALVAAGAASPGSPGSIDLAPALRRLTFDAFAVAVVGEELATPVFDDFMLLARGGDARIQAKLPLKLVRLPRGFEAARARFYGHFAERARAARQAPDPRAVHLLARTLREMPGIDDQVLAHILGLVFYGGVFSASTALIGALHQLEKHADAEERLAREAAELAEGELTLARLRGARWVEAVMHESLRLLPPVRLFTRSPLADVELAGVTLPAGAMILISNQHLHRDPAHWRDPDTFDPTRWLEGGVARDPVGSGHYFPFGRGPRACLGSRFALVYLQTALATLAARARVRVDSTEPFEEGFFFGVVLPLGVMGKFVARSALRGS